MYINEHKGLRDAIYAYKYAPVTPKWNIFNARDIVYEFNADGYYTRFYLRKKKPCEKRISRIEYNRNPPFSAVKKLNCYRRFIKIASRQWSLFIHGAQSKYIL